MCSADIASLPTYERLSIPIAQQPFFKLVKRETSLNAKRSQRETRNTFKRKTKNAFQRETCYSFSINNNNESAVAL